MGVITYVREPKQHVLTDAAQHLAHSFSKPAHLRVDDLAWGGLQPLSFELQPGKVLGVVGSNGAGKSTLLKLLYRLYQPKSGKVFIDNEELHQLSGREAAQRVAAVVQEQPSELSLSALDIIKLGLLPHGASLSKLSTEHQHLIDWVLDLLSLTHLVRRKFTALSGGERQRVMIGRALVQHPGLLVLDEPTNHLDIRHQLEVLRLIQQMNVTVVVALHDLNLALAYTDDILILNQGYPVAHGPTQEILNTAHINQAFSIRAKRQHQDSYFTFSLPTNTQSFA